MFDHEDPLTMGKQHAAPGIDKVLLAQDGICDINVSD
jgi:hypothetical protein